MLMIYYKHSFNYIRIKLNNRLVRRILKEYKKYIKKKNLNSINAYNTLITYKKLRRLWKHPNYHRFHHEHEPMYPKSINERYLYIGTHGNIYIGAKNLVKDSKTYKIVDKHSGDINEIIKYMLIFAESIPF